MYQQRSRSGRLPPEAPWRPEVEAGPFEIGAEDGYAVVDDLEDGEAVVVVTPWPWVDAAGRLVFEEASDRLEISSDALQEAVNVARQAAGQSPWDRPLRVGDVFLLPADSWRGLLAGAGELRLVDVTKPARAVAHAALLTAANAALRGPGPADHVDDLDDSDVTEAGGGRGRSTPASSAWPEV